jgi:hypothetical protein
MKGSLRSLAVTAALTLVAAAPAAAAPSGSAAGSFTAVGQSLTVRTVDGYTFVHEIATHAWSGTIVGSSVLDVRFVASPSGFLRYVGTGTFTGTTPCGVGTARFLTTGSGPVPGPIDGIAAWVAGSVPFHANLDVVLSLTAEQNATGTYSGTFRCS